MMTTTGNVINVATLTKAQHFVRSAELKNLKKNGHALIVVPKIS